MVLGTKFDSILTQGVLYSLDSFLQLCYQLTLKKYFRMANE
jgi:hypothetical protein